MLPATRPLRLLVLRAAAGKGRPESTYPSAAQEATMAGRQAGSGSPVGTALRPGSPAAHPHAGPGGPRGAGTGAGRQARCGAPVGAALRPGSPDAIRNVVLVGPSGSGKTTLVEALLAATGVINRAGRGEDGAAAGDGAEAGARQ